MSIPAPPPKPVRRLLDQRQANPDRSVYFWTDIQPVLDYAMECNQRLVDKEQELARLERDLTAIRRDASRQSALYNGGAQIALRDIASNASRALR